MKLLKPIISAAVTLYVLSWALPTVTIANWTALILAGLVLVLINKFLRPILKILFLPINIITLGLFSVVINVALLWLVTYLVPGFQINDMVLFGVPLNSFMSILVTSILIGFVNSFVSFVL